MVNIGELYANGYGVPRDDIKARDWRKKAAVTIEQKGSNDASKLLGLILAAAPGATVRPIRFLLSNRKIIVTPPDCAIGLEIGIFGGVARPRDVIVLEPDRSAPRGCWLLAVAVPRPRRGR